MKKFALYIIIFLSIFIGTISAVVVNGYIKYENEKQDAPSLEAEDSVLTTLASSILESEAYSGNILFTSNDNSASLNGTFAYINNGTIEAQINLNGKINNFPVNTTLTLINEDIYIDFNGAKINCTTNDVLAVLNGVINTINTGSNSAFSAINIDQITSSVSNLIVNETAGGYTLSLPIKNLCDIYLLTDINYVPKQILVTNLKFGKTTYSLNVTASQTKSTINYPNTTQYLSISNSLEYLPPLLNTLSQNQLRLSGTINYNSTELKLNIYKNGNILLGDITHKSIKLNFEYENGYIILKLFNNYFKFTPKDALSLIKDLLGVDLSTPLNITDINIIEITKNFNTTIKTNNNLISNIGIDYSGLTLNLNVGKTLIMPSRIEKQDYYLSTTDVKNFITYYKNIFSSNYSMDISLSYTNVTANGKLYVEISENFNAINNLLFDGKVNNLPLTIWYHSETTYISLDGNNIKLSNASIPKLIESISDLLNIESSKTLEDIIKEFDLTNITYKNRKLSLISKNNEISVCSYFNNYKVNIVYNDIKANITLYPNSEEYSYINNKLDESKFNDLSNAPSLINALNSTINQTNINYSGNLTLNILDFKYANVFLDIKYNKTQNKLTITLDNLPIDSVVTYFSNLYYTNQKCTLTIYNGNINICTTVTTRVFNRTVCVADTTLPLSSFSVDNLYEIMGMRKSIIKQFKQSNSTGNSSDILTNLSTDCIKLLKTKLIFNYSTMFNKYVASVYATFNYKTYITSLNANLNIGDILFVKINLYRY